MVFEGLGSSDFKTHVLLTSPYPEYHTSNIKGPYESLNGGLEQRQPGIKFSDWRPLSIPYFDKVLRSCGISCMRFNTESILKVFGSPVSGLL